MAERHSSHLPDRPARGGPTSVGFVGEEQAFRARSGPHTLPGDDEEGSVSFRALLAGLVRYKWLVLAAIVLGGVGGYVAWHQVEPEYLARGSLWVRGGGTGEVGPITTEGILPAQSWMDLLQSYTVLDPVVERQKLYIRPARAADFALLESLEITEALVPGGYTLAVSEDGEEAVLFRGDEEVDRAPIGDPIGRGQGILWATPATGLAPGREVEFNLTTPRSAAVRLQNDVLSQMDPRGSFILIQLSGADPDRIAGTVNGLMENHVELAAELKRGTLDQEYATLSTQLQTAERELAEAERALETFRVQTITLPSEDTRAIQPGLEMTRGPVFDEFFEMRVRQEQLRRDLERLRSIHSEIVGGEARFDALETIPAVANASQLQAALQELNSARAEERTLLQRYTAEYPAVQEVSARVRQLEEERIPTVLARFIQQLETEQGVLAGQMASSEADLSDIPPRAIEEARLRRRVEIAAEFYTELQGRFQFANLARASSQPDIQILDRAAPPEAPATDPRPTLALAVFSIFLGLGLGGALLAARLDSRLRTPDEIQSAFGLTVLGAIPRIRGGGGATGGMKNTGQVREALRELRTNLTYAYGAAGPLVVTISSPGMEEGKTTVTSNLGIAFAELGHRTLIIDADTRRGDLHHFLGGVRKPGLTNYLQGRCSADVLIQDTAHDGLEFIGSGTQVSNSPELLSSRGMGEMMSALKQDYDVIIVDSPPLGAGADALVLGSITGHMMLVIRSGATDRGFMQAKLEPLERLPLRVLGVVLNDYQPSRLSSDQYKYYSSYLPGYEAGAEEDLEDRDGGAAGSPEERTGERDRRLPASVGGARPDPSG